MILLSYMNIVIKGCKRLNQNKCKINTYKMIGKTFGVVMDRMNISTDELQNTRKLMQFK